MSDTDTLKAAFNTGLETAQSQESIEDANDAAQPPLKPKAVVKAEPEVEVPAGFLKEEKEVKADEHVDEPLVTEDIRAKIPKGKASESFAALENAAKAKIDALRKENAELKGRPAAAANPEIETELKTTREKTRELEEKIERIAFQESPKYQKFGTEEKAEIAAAKSYIEGSEINPAILEAAASTHGAARMKLLTEAGLDANTIAIVAPHLARVDAIRRERDASLESWKQTVGQEQEQTKAQQKQAEEQRVAQEKQVFEKVRMGMSKLPAFTKVDGQDKWNALVEQNLKESEDFFHGRKSLEELAQLGFRGVAQKTTELMNKELVKQVDALRAENTKLKAAQPDTAARGETETKKVSADDPKNSFEHHKNAFNSAKAALTGE